MTATTGPGGLVWGLALPALALVALAWLVPRALARVFPEGVAALAALAGVAVVAVWALAAALFAGLYVAAGAPATLLWDEGAASVRQFGRLGLVSSLVWAPVLALSVADLPRRWRRALW